MRISNNVNGIESRGVIYIPPKEFNMSREILMQVREMIERNLNMHEIAQRMHVDVTVVQSALKLINDMLT